MDDWAVKYRLRELKQSLSLTLVLSLTVKGKIKTEQSGWDQQFPHDLDAGAKTMIPNSDSSRSRIKFCNLCSPSFHNVPLSIFKDNLTSSPESSVCSRLAGAHRSLLDLQRCCSPSWHFLLWSFPCAAGFFFFFLFLKGSFPSPLFDGSFLLMLDLNQKIYIH